MQNMSTIDDNNDQSDGDCEEMKSSNKECISCEQNNIDNITESIDSVAILDDMSACANCGKEGNSKGMNICNKCKMVKYCNAACKKKHRTKHKKACERRVAELHEEALFKDPPPREECPICMLPLPLDAGESTFYSCCGKRICNGCILMLISDEKGLCAFCRTPPPSSDEERVKQIKNLMDKGNGGGFYQLASFYARGVYGIPQNFQKTNELLLKAGELGCAEGYHNLGLAYDNGRGVEADKKKAQHYYELAAIGGHLLARHNLGCVEEEAGNQHRAIKHWLISARAGSERSLDAVKIEFRNGLVTKDVYANTLRAYHESQKEMKNNERNRAQDCFEVYHALTGGNR